MLEPDDTEQQLLAANFADAQRPLTSAQRWVEALMSALFALGVAALWLLAEPSGSWHLGPAAACVVAAAAAYRVRFDVGLGFTPATPLAFAAMAFTMPAQALPIAMVLACLGSALALDRHRRRPRELALVLGNHLYTLGPAAVLVVMGPAAEQPAWVLLVALFTQTAVDFTTSLARVAVRTRIDVREELRLAGPVYTVDSALAVIGLPAGLLVATNPWAPIALLPLVALLHVFSRERRARLEHVLELNRAYRGVALVLGDVVEADDGYTGAHSHEVLELALDVGRRLDLHPSRMRNLEFGALLHDVGKITVPKEILNKPGKLTPEEFEVMKGHAAAGQEILDRVGGFMRDVGRIVRHHHERWDGGGYPDGLAGEDIPIEARIITACDSWNAMRTDRVYRKALSLEVAEAEVRDGAGGQFDPAVADALLAATAASRAAVRVSAPAGSSLVAGAGSEALGVAAA